jgi:hypothetical protein
VNVLGRPSPDFFSSLISIGVGGLVNGVLGELSLWVNAGASEMLDGVGAALAATTAAPLNDEFAAVYALVRDVGAAMAGIFFMLALLRSIVRQDLADLGRILLIRLPLALVGAVAALQVVELAVQATDALSTSLLNATSPSGSTFPSSLAALLDSVGSGLNGGFELGRARHFLVGGRGRDTVHPFGADRSDLDVDHQLGPSARRDPRRADLLQDRRRGRLHPRAR